MRPPALLRAWLAALPGLCLGCGLVFPAPTPMRTVRELADDQHPSRCAVVFLPGFGDDEHAFIEHGFGDALRARSLRVDTIFTDATYGYYAKNTILTRLREDVMTPAMTRRYEQIWVVGVSMGGLGALLLAKESEPKIAGVYLLAPYLGEDAILREIDSAGGLAQWQPGPVAKSDYERDLWRFLKVAVRQPDGPPAIYLGAGDHDKLAHGHRILAAALPQSHVFSVPGRHDWGPWSTLWAHFLDAPDFRARCD
jgi:pimeloyl-ACP methyl ester carboxylesterase